MAKLVFDTLQTLSWEVLSHATCSSDLAPPDYHLFALMGRSLSYEDIKNGSMNGSQQKEKISGVAFINCMNDGKTIQAMEHFLFFYRI